MEPQEPRRAADPSSEQPDASSLSPTGSTSAGGSSSGGSSTAGSSTFESSTLGSSASDGSGATQSWQSTPSASSPSFQQGAQPQPEQPSTSPPSWAEPPVQQTNASWQQQPAQPSWGQPASGWGDPNATVVAEHRHNVAVALASVFLGFIGLLFTVLGLVFLLGGSAFADAIGRSGADLSGVQLDQLAAAAGVGGVVLLVIGIPHILAAIWAPLHSGWARILGIIVSVLGVLLGLLTLATPSTSVEGTRTSPLVAALFFLVPYGLTLATLLFSRKHFRR